MLRHREHLEELIAERTRKLQEAQGELIRKERLATLGQLTATVSHELRNPLGAIKPSLYVIKKKIPLEDERLQEAIARVERSVDRCDHIIDELLDFTRIRDLGLEPTSLDEWLGDVLDEQPMPDGLTLVRELSLSGMAVPIDPERMRRAVVNVYDNACQAMLGERLDGEGKLTVRTRAVNGRVEIEIADTGPGILPEDQAKIFEPLFSTKGFGVGLGLPTVKQIMEQHGGGIEVDSEPGKGARTVLWLPFATIDEVGKVS